MPSFAFIQKEKGAEVARLAATDVSRLKTTDGEPIDPVRVRVGTVLANGPHGALRVDHIIVR